MLVAGAVVLALGACSRDQDPGIVPTATTRADGETTVPQLIGECPPGGPDTTIPPAGCVDEDGIVQH